MTNKLRKFSRKSVLQLHKTIKKFDHLRKCSSTEKEVFFRNKEIKFLFEELLDEIDSDTVKEEYRGYPDEVKRDLVWNHELNLEKYFNLTINIDLKNKHILRDLSKLYQDLTFNCICVIKRFECNKGIKKLLHLLKECIKNNCKDKEVIIWTLKCLKSFGNNHYGVTRLCEDNMVYEILCRLICNSHSEEILIALDLLSVFCFINRYACNKIISCFTKINEGHHNNRFRPLIVCLMNRNQIDIQRSIMYFINALLHSTQNATNHSIQLRVELRKELYQMGFETYLNAYRQSDDTILCHQADIFMNKSHLDKEEIDFDFLQLRNELPTLQVCENEWNKILHDENHNNSSIVQMMQLLIFHIRHNKSNIPEIIKYFHDKLQTSNYGIYEKSNRDILSDQLLSDSRSNVDDEIYFQSLHNTDKDTISIISCDVQSCISDNNKSTSDNIKDSGLSQTADENNSAVFFTSESGSFCNSSIFEETNLTNQENFSEDNFNDDLNTTITENNSNILPDLTYQTPVKMCHSFKLEPEISLVSSVKSLKRRPLSWSPAYVLSMDKIEEMPLSDRLLSGVTGISHQSGASEFVKLESQLGRVITKKESTIKESAQYTSQFSTPLPPPPPPALSLPPGPPPPPPPPPPLGLMKKVSLTPGLVKKAVKQLNVTLISEANINENSIWINFKEQSSNKQIIDQLYDRFSSKKSTEIKHKTLKPLIVMESKIAQNFEIFLRSINKANEVLLTAIREMDTTLITSDMVDKFMSIIPDKEGVEKLESFSNKLEELRSCEQFLFHLIQIDNLKTRISGIHLQILISNNSLNDVESNLNLLTATFGTLLSSTNFKTVLKMVLFLTQAMKPDKMVMGITIDSLCKLIDTKDNKNGNLLQFLIEKLQEKNPECLELWEDFKTLDVVTSISKENIDSTIAQFSSALEKVEKDIEEIDCQTLKTKILATVKVATFLLCEVNELKNIVDRKYRSVCEYLCITKQTYSFEHLFCDLKTFKSQFHLAMKQISEKKHIEALQKEKQNSITEMKKQQTICSDDLASILSALNKEKAGANKSKCVFKPESFIDNTIIGIQSGKIFSEDAILNWGTQYHRNENHKCRMTNRRSYLPNLTPSRTRRFDKDQILIQEAQDQIID